MLIYKLSLYNFLSQECVGAGGSEEGSCAGGFGVCCTCKLKDENNFQIIQKFTKQYSSCRNALEVKIEMKPNNITEVTEVKQT